MDYASSGVDIDAEGKAISSLIDALGSSVRKAGQKGAPVPLPGGFGGIVEFGDSRLVLATDGVGSKLQLASQTGWLRGVGIDCIAMNVNDLICVGAEPIAFVDYIAVPKTDPGVHAELGHSLAEGCRQARVTLAGGETATLPGIVTELDLSGTALGWFPKGGEVTGERLESGDSLIGLPSSGIHSNGYTLVRAVLERSGAPLDIKAIAHITGGGLSNLLRLHETLGWHIDDPLPVHPEFSWIADVGSVNSREMHRTFNMGMGMVVAVSHGVSDDVTEWFSDRLPGTRRVGSATDSGKVTHADSSVVFDHY